MAVTMWHPQSAQTMKASQDAYERVWKAQGWTLVQPEEKPEDKPRPRKAARAKAE